MKCIVLFLIIGLFFAYIAIEFLGLIFTIFRGIRTLKGIWINYLKEFPINADIRISLFRLHFKGRMGVLFILVIVVIMLGGVIGMLNLPSVQEKLPKECVHKEKHDTLYVIRHDTILVTKHDTINRDNKDVSTKEVPIIPNINVNVINNITNRFNGEQNNYYIARQLPSDEIIKGQKGKYYQIDLKDSHTSKTIFFEAGKYEIPTFDVDFGKALSQLILDINKLNQNNINCKIYTLGKADLLGSKSFKSTLPKSLDLNIHRQISKGAEIFETSESQVSIPIVFGNEYLPNLRANFMKERITAMANGSNRVEILEGSVVGKVDTYFRNTTILVFLEK